MPPVIVALYTLCCLLLLGLAAFIFQKNPHSQLHRSFALSALSLVGWLATLVLYNLQTQPGFLLLLGRLNFVCGLLIVTFLYLFVIALTEKPVTARRLVLAETLLLSAVTLLTPWIDQAEYVTNGQHSTVFGSLFPLYLIHLVVYLIATLTAAALAARSASRELRSRLALIGLGIFLTAIIAVTTNVLLPFLFHDFAWQNLGALSTIFFLVAVAYAISVHHLFDVRILLRRTIVFTLLLAFTLAVYSGGILVLTQALPFAASGAQREVLTVIGILLIAFSFDPLRRWLEVKTDRFLFRQEFEQQQVIGALARDLTAVTELDKALELLLNTLTSVFHLRSAAIFVFEPGEKGGVSIKKMQQHGFSSTARLFFKELDALPIAFQDFRVPMKLRDVAKQGHKRAGNNIAVPSPQPLLDKLTSLGIEVAVPLHLNGQLAGLLLVGGKRSGADFGVADMALLDALGVQALSAIQKARLFESDQTKTEFVSIASHELLTPITAVEGYLSMILDEHLGTVDAQAHEYLSKAYPAIKRLAELVKDLLSVSRLEAGRIQVVSRPTDITMLIHDAIDQLAPVAREKHLALTFEPPTVPLSLVLADPARTMEVLINLIGNALKYTPKGAVTITASKLDSSDPSDAQATVQIAIRDTGIGMDKAAQQHLFEKFYRADNARTSGISGTGLGLYITKAMVEKMGGTIIVESTLGSGSTVRLRLPAVPTEGILPG